MDIVWNHAMVVVFIKEKHETKLVSLVLFVRVHHVGVTPVEGVKVSKRNQIKPVNLLDFSLSLPFFFFTLLSNLKLGK